VSFKLIGPRAHRGWLLCGLFLATQALAQSDEFQVYTGEIAAPGVLNLTLHNIYVADGISTPRYPGAIVADHSFTGGSEWAWGVAPWLELGAYLPIYSVAADRLHFDGTELRALFVTPDAAHRSFIYGVNFSLDLNTPDWDDTARAAEIRPILGWSTGPVRVSFNPVLESAFNGLARLEFSPEARAEYALSKTWTAAVEDYSSFGPLRHFKAAGQQEHQLFGVADWQHKELLIEAGVGFGLTGASDRLTWKLLLSHDII
jgi:hypothetical protein